MNEFDDASMEFSETETIEVPETSDWVDFDSAETNDISIDTAENVDDFIADNCQRMTCSKINRVSRTGQVKFGSSVVLVIECFF